MKYISLFENTETIKALKTDEPLITIECDHDVGNFDDETTLTQKTTIHYKKGDRLTINNYSYPTSGNIPSMYPIYPQGWISSADIIKHFKVI